MAFSSWFSILVNAQWFSSRLGRIFRVTEKVLLRVTAKVCGIVLGVMAKNMACFGVTAKGR